ncbi:MAG TPA: MBOAT family protein [Candidatus Gracilibacteria bacterium]
MLFNSFPYLFLFFPIVLAGFYILGYVFPDKNWHKVWIAIASLYFYAYWEISYLWLISASILCNYGLSLQFPKPKKRPKKKEVSYRRLLLGVGMVFNLGLLGYYKYADFFLGTVNTLAKTHFEPLNIILPLAISFFTFQQIAYLVDCAKGEVADRSFLNYLVFVTFFPQLIAGPIVHHKEMMPQFASKVLHHINYQNFALGLSIFALGIFKKVIIADSFAIWANEGFAQAAALGTMEAWRTSLSYTMQLYFDFSGYTDMAIGSALFFNIKLPFNFNQPYLALSIQDFWARWHITLSRFLKDYIYIPLGGSRGGEWKTYRNIFLVFFVSGLWHGAGWTFVFWGVMHGLAMWIHRAWKSVGGELPKPLAWFITFNFVNIGWVFFRATSFEQALQVLRAMFGLATAPPSGALFTWPESIGAWMPILTQPFDHSWIFYGLPFLLGSLVVALPILWGSTSDAEKFMKRFKPSPLFALVTISMLVAALMSMHKASEFLYFNF